MIWEKIFLNYTFWGYEEKQIFPLISGRITASTTHCVQYNLRHSLQYLYILLLRWAIKVFVFLIGNNIISVATISKWPLEFNAAVMYRYFFPKKHTSPEWTESLFLSQWGKKNLKNGEGGSWDTTFLSAGFFSLQGNIYMYNSPHGLKWFTSGKALALNFTVCMKGHLKD